MASCGKDVNYRPCTDDVINTTDSSYKSEIVFRLATLEPSGGSMFRWNSGYLSMRTIIFNATKQIGNKVVLSKYETPVIADHLNIFSTGYLGTLKVPPMAYDHTFFSIGLGRSETASAFVLNGTYTGVATTMPLRTVPVQIIVNETAVINTVWLPDITIGDGHYAALIQLSLDQLMSGIDETMMNSATSADGVIAITSTSNESLYNIIIGNLQNGTMGVQFSQVFQNTPWPVNE